MSETQDDNRGAEPSRSLSQREHPAGLLERLRSFLGLSQASVRDDIEEAIDESAGAEFTPQERAILKNVLALHDVRVADVMVPRADIVALPLDTPLRAVLDLFREAGHSRLPVYEETLDDPRGMIYIRDFVVFLASDPRFGLIANRAADSEAAATSGLDMPLSEARILRPVLYAPPSMPALDLLLRMQASRTHMALVIDEYGGTDGLVSIEDVVESIVGDIEDEHDEAEAQVLSPTGDGAFIAEARAPLEDISQSGRLRFLHAGRGRGGRYDRRPRDRARGPRSRPRRDHPRTGRVRVRGLGCRSASAEAAEDLARLDPRGKGCLHRQSRGSKAERAHLRPCARSEFASAWRRRRPGCSHSRESRSRDGRRRGAALRRPRRAPALRSEPRLGMAQAGDRLCVRRRRGVRASALLAAAVDGGDDDGRSLAHRWVWRWGRGAPVRGRMEGLRRRLVDGFRLLCRRPLVARIRLPGRRGEVRLGAAARRSGPPRRARILSSRGLRPRQASVVSGPMANFRARVRTWRQRVGALSRLHRISLERLWHDARGQRNDGADRLHRRIARADLSHGGDFRRPGDALARRRANERSLRPRRRPASPCF